MSLTTSVACGRILFAAKGSADKLPCSRCGSGLVRIWKSPSSLSSGCIYPAGAGCFRSTVGSIVRNFMNRAGIQSVTMALIAPIL
jgi:hypothetical protein